MLEAYLVTLAGLIAMQVSPGPNLIAIASAAMGQSRRAALLVALGIATGAVIWVMLAALGIGVLVKAYPALLTVLKFAGGGYLLWIAIKALIAAKKGKIVQIPKAEQTVSDWASWRRGLLVVLTNPKVALGWTAIASFLFGSGLSALQVAAFAPLAAASAMLIYGGYGFLFSTGVAVRIYRRFFRIVEATFGVLFGVMGTSLILAGARDLRP